MSSASTSWPRTFKAVTAGGALFVALLAVEVLLRIVAPRDLSGTWLTTGAGGYDVNRAGTVARHRQAGQQVSYSINSLGFRGPEPSTAGKRVLVLGDSVTFGWLLDESSTYVSRLQAAATEKWGAGRVDMLNAAVGGWGIGEYVAFLEDAGQSLRPDAILVFLSGDEPERAVESGLWRLDQDGVPQRVRNQAQTRRALHQLNRLPGYNWLIEHSQVAHLVRRALIETMMSRPGAGGDRDPPNVPAMLRLTEALHDRLIAWSRTHGIPLSVVGTGVFEAQGENGANRRFMQSAPAFFQQRGVAYLDLWPRLTFVFEDPERYRIAGDPHPNAFVASQVAQLTWPWLEERLRAANIP